jgi:hypothetical protein
MSFAVFLTICGLLPGAFAAKATASSSVFAGRNLSETTHHNQPPPWCRQGWL